MGRRGAADTGRDRSLLAQAGPGAVPGRVKLLLIDSHGYLHDDFTKILPPAQFDICRVRSGRQALEELVVGQMQPAVPGFDIVIVPHEADAGDGAGICHALRRLYGKRALIVLAFLPPYLEEAAVLGYLAAEVDEVCIYPLSRLAMRNRFLLLADLVTERRRARVVGTFQTRATSFGSIELAAAAAASLIAEDPRVMDASLIADDNLGLLPLEGQPVHKHCGLAYRMARNLFAATLDEGRQPRHLFVTFRGAPQPADTDFVLALLGAIASAGERPIEIDTMRGLLAIQDGRHEITVIRGANQYAEVIFASGARQLLPRTPLKTIAGQFGDDFVQCHRSFLIAERRTWSARINRSGRFALRHSQHEVPVGDCYLPAVRATHPGWFH